MSRDPLRNLRALRHKVDAHSRRVESEHAPEFACRRGCDGCCQTERTVSDVEYAAVAQALAAVGADVHQRLAAQRQAEHCTLLLDGACAIYQERPLICRSHGLPLVMEGQLDVCPLNFEDLRLSALPLADVLNIDSVTAVLVAVNALYCQEEGGDPQRRRDVGEFFL
ncbi:MAG TPA: YkgJ family cysteine cluster protein [Myxococcota bacterium]|nr:YkgJ family cysteine cluster protein [Myxococcota bacterium]